MKWKKVDKEPPPPYSWRGYVHTIRPDQTTAGKLATYWGHEREGRKGWEIDDRSFNEVVYEYLDEQADDWIDADITPPQLHQDCAFIVISKHDPNLNGRVLGGRYYGDVHGCHEFAVPGHGYYAKLWQPLPSTPQGGDNKIK